jgi:hypothetical protein
LEIPLSGVERLLEWVLEVVVESLIQEAVVVEVVEEHLLLIDLT